MKVDAFRQRGAMYEINAWIWPALYGYTGWLWGAALDWPVAGAIAAAVLGFLVGVAMMTVNPYGFEFLVIPAALVLPWLLEAETWRWTAAALCIVPLPRLALGLILKKKWT